MKINITLFYLVAILCLFSCMSEKEEEKQKAVENSESNTSSDDPIAQMKSAMEEIEKQANGKNGEKVKTIHFKELHKAIPEKFNGYTRTNKEGNTSSFMGMKISTASAEYKSGDKEIDVEIVDTGGMGMAVMGMAAWSQIETESESEDGWEKTTMIDGHKAFESYDKSSKRAELNILAKERLIINLSGDDVEMDDLKKFAKKILKGL